MKTHSCCPTCGRTMPKPKGEPTADTAEMTDKQLFAHYAKLAPFDDLRFLLAHSTNGIHERGSALLATGDGTAIKRELPKLRGAWRESVTSHDYTRKYPNMRDWSPEAHKGYLTFVRVATAWNKGRANDD